MIFSHFVYLSLYMFATGAQVLVSYLCSPSFNIFVNPQGSGTVQPAESFDPVNDADKLHVALTASNTRIKDLVDLLTKRSCAQRMEIKEKFEQKYGRDSLDQLLCANIPTENKCRYDMLLPSCFVCNATLNAYHAGKTIVDDLINVFDITDIMVFCSQTAELHDKFAAEFDRINGKKLTDWLEEHTSDDFNSVLMEIATRTRAAEPPVDPDFIQTMAQGIYEEREEWEDCREKLDGALWETPMPELKHILNAFKQRHGKNLYEEMWKFDDDKAYVYQSMHNFVTNVTDFYSKELNQCFGVKDFNGLLFMRIVLITSETNLAEIKQAYQEDYNKSIEEEVKQNLCFKDNEEYRSLMYGFLGISST